MDICKYFYAPLSSVFDSEIEQWNLLLKYCFFVFCFCPFGRAVIDTDLTETIKYR